MGIPSSTIDLILSYTSDLVSHISENFIELIKTNTNIRSSIVEKAEISRFQIKRIFDLYNSTYKRNKIISNSEFFVKPIQISILTRYDRKYCKITRKYKRVIVQNTFQYTYYISIVNSLQALFKNLAFAEIYFENDHICSNEKLRGFCYASVCKNSKFFAENPKAIQIQLYYDYFECMH